MDFSLKHLALFNGIGGFQLASDWMGWENVAHVEINDWCNKVVKQHFPNSKCYTDIKNFDGKEYAGTIDIITGGFPCQPFSVAGKRKGNSDDRALWYEMYRIIREVKPTFVIGENVTGLINMENGETYKNILSDLENEGYKTESFIIPACSIGAWHKRDRLWIIAYSIGSGARYKSREIDNEKWSSCESRGKSIRQIYGEACTNRINSTSSNVTNSNGQGLEIIECERANNEQECQASKRSNYKRQDWTIEPGICRVVNGLPNRVDRIKGLGNAIVPQVAYEIFEAISNSFEKTEERGQKVLI